MEKSHDTLPGPHASPTFSWTSVVWPERCGWQIHHRSEVSPCWPEQQGSTYPGSRAANQAVVLDRIHADDQDDADATGKPAARARPHSFSGDDRSVAGGGWVKRSGLSGPRTLCVVAGAV